MLLSILEFSLRFRDAATHLEDLKWASFTKCILENKRSLEFFAKSHHVPSLQALQYYDKASGSAILAADVAEPFEFVLPPNDHPHNWYLPLANPPQRKK